MAEHSPEGMRDLEDEEGGKLTGPSRQNWGRWTKEYLPFLSPWPYPSFVLFSPLDK